MSVRKRQDIIKALLFLPTLIFVWFVSSTQLTWRVFAPLPHFAEHGPHSPSNHLGSKKRNGNMNVCFTGGMPSLLWGAIVCIALKQRRLRSLRQIAQILLNFRPGDPILAHGPRHLIACIQISSILQRILIEKQDFTHLHRMSRNRVTWILGSSDRGASSRNCRPRKRHSCPPAASSPASNRTQRP